MLKKTLSKFSSLGTVKEACNNFKVEYLQENGRKGQPRNFSKVLRYTKTDLNIEAGTYCKNAEWHKNRS